MSVDLTENDEMYTLQAVLPGVSPDAVDIDFAEGVLTIKAQSQEAGHAEGTRYHLRERFYGDYERTFRFPSPIDSEGIEAAYENGILTVALPKAESVKSRRIHVKKSL
jgi:HSP20 family protein